MRPKVALVLVLFSATALAQSLAGCGSLKHNFDRGIADDCSLVSLNSDGGETSDRMASSLTDGAASTSDPLADAPLATAPMAIGVGLLRPESVRKESFHWRRALLESFMFLSIEQAYVVKDDFRWVVAENGVPLNHYWRDYKQSLSTWVNSGWDDGDPALYSYLGHPIQGALSGYIQVQNDPQGEKLEFSNTREYWRSRLKALLWNAVYSTQWNIGPVSELTFEKYGTKARPPWNHDGTWPCHEKNCFTGVGQVDLITTPFGGFGWMIMEDVVDKKLVRRVESATDNHFLINVTRCALNPIRGGANILHGKVPWYRGSRDGDRRLLAAQQ